MAAAQVADKSLPCQAYIAGSCLKTDTTCKWSHNLTFGPISALDQAVKKHAVPVDIDQPSKSNVVRVGYCYTCRQAIDPEIEFTFPCGHSIHTRCLGPWQMSCPVFKCNRSLVAERLGEIDDNHPLVWEIIVAFTLTAVKSDRYAIILTPFPDLEGIGNDIVRLREIAASTVTVMQMLRAVVIPQPSRSLVNWIINSNTSTIKRIAKPIPFLESAHQFLFIDSTQKHTQAFIELKKTKKTVWAFHGSSPENWHSIIRNGLVNASNTALRMNGAAKGPGIYLSQYASTSFGYSKMTATANPVPMKMADDIIRDEFRCITICEVIDESINKASQNIWVQPNESHVLTRFLFVFNARNIGGMNAILSDAQYVAQLDQAMGENFV